MDGGGALARGSSRYGDKAGWLQKKKPGKDWETVFCVVRHGTLDCYADEKAVAAAQGAGASSRRASVALAGAKLEHKVPVVLLSGSQDSHHGTDQYSFMVAPRAAAGKRPERHIFKAMTNEEKLEWYSFLWGQSGQGRAGPAGPAGAAEHADGGDDDGGRTEEGYVVDEVLSRLEIYASLVSFRVQRKFIHILQSQRPGDNTHLRTLVHTMVGLSTSLKDVAAAASRAPALLESISEGIAPRREERGLPPLPSRTYVASASDSDTDEDQPPPLPTRVRSRHSRSTTRAAPQHHTKAAAAVAAFNVTPSTRSSTAAAVAGSRPARVSARFPATSTRSAHRSRRASLSLEDGGTLTAESDRAYNTWPFMTGWMLKKGRKRRNWNQRWFVLVGPFLLYYENPQHQIVHELIADAVLFLKDYVLITTDELQSKCASIRSYDQANVLRTMQNHPDCFVLQSKDRELFLEPPPQSARSHSTAQWVRKLRLGMQMGQHVANKDAALEMLLVQGSGLVDRQSALPMVISDACLSRVFRETLPQEQKSMLGAMDQLFTGFPPTLPTLVRPTRYLQRCGKLKHLDGGIRSDVAVFLFNDILLCADLIEERHVHLRQVAQTHMPRAKYRYAAHHSLVDLHYEEELEGGTLEFAVKVKGIQSLGLDAEEHIYAEFRSDPTLRFEAPSKLQKLNWAEDLRDKIKQAKEPSNNMERFEGAVIFADVSGFSNLGDLLERKEREALGQSGADNPSSVGPSAAEGLATFLGIEVEKMVEVVTRGGGDVIKFAGDCVIAVFPAEDYLDLEKDLDYAYTALALATGQAARVSVQMVNKQKQVVARAQEKRYEDDISRLVAELNIHVAIGSGMVYGYHVGGVDRKWEYLIDGPVMSQVRSADGDAGAGEVALSKEAYELVKSIDMKKKILKTGNVRLITYHGPQQEPNFKRPWETLTDDTTRANLAKLLMQYAAEPVVEQVEAQLPTVAQHKLISTAFCRLIGIDYETDEGEVAVMELGAITSQVQLVLRRHGGTLTRVISDDKGTSMLLAFEDAHSAVEAAVDMHRSIVSIPVAAGMQPFKTAIGITTGNVWIGCVGGRIRSEYTMHGSHVNFAARLMTCPIIKNVGGILCDEATMRAAPGIDFISQEPRQFKGFTEKVVSYMPHMPVTSRELSEDSLQRQVAAHREEVGRWETLLQGAGLGSGGQGALVVVETSQENHWHLDSLFEAIDKRRNQHGPKAPVRRCCWPMFETSPVAGGMASGHRSSDTRNEEQLLSLLAQHSLLHDSVHVVERANVLSATGWAMLYKLAEQSSRRKYSGGVLVITLNSAGRASRSGAAALESACASAWSWSALAPSIAFLHMVWCHGKVQPHFASDEVELSRNSMGLEPEPEEETEVTPSRSKLVSPAVHRPRIRTADLVGVDRLYTLKVAAVLSHDVGEECGFPAQMMLQLHPMILTKQWGTQTVDSHLRYFAENADPSTGRATLHRIASSFRNGGGAAAGMCGADDEGYYVFDSVQLQQFRYRQMIFQQRSRIHRNAAAYFRQKMRSDLSGDEDRLAVAVYQNLITFHREAAGVKAIPQ